MKPHGILLLSGILLLVFPNLAVPQQEQMKNPFPDGQQDNPVNAEALERIRMAAEEGLIPAQFQLGLAYLQGKEIPQDYREAAKWFRKAAQHGNAEAQCMLGAMHAEGLGVTQDYIESYMWLIMSVDGLTDRQSQIRKMAIDWRDAIAKNMTQGQIQEAERLRKEWEIAHVQRVDDGVYLAGRGVLPPVTLVRPTPRYTEQARQARIQGVVLLQCVIRKDGTVDGFKILRELGYGLDESAINTIKAKWRFQPGTLQGKPVDVQVNIEVMFKLFQ